MAVGVILNLIISTNPFLAIILLQVTPTAKRNSYRVAILVGRLPRVASFARNPGLGKRNSVRVAAACGLSVYSCFYSGDRHIRKGRSPEKPQIFLYLYHADYAYYNR